MSGYKVVISKNPLTNKPRADVLFKGKGEIDTGGYTVDEYRLAECKSAGEAYMDVEDTPYPENATGREIHAIDVMIDEKLTALQVAAANLARTAKVVV